VTEQPDSPRDLATTIRLDPILIDAARREAGLSANTSVQALVRYALARLADWPDDVALVISRTSHD